MNKYKWPIRGARHVVSPSLSVRAFLLPVLKLTALCSLLSMLNFHAFAAELAVINQAGEVWARDLSENAVGAGNKLMGPGLFGGPDDQFVIGHEMSIDVITKSGVVWEHSISNGHALLPGQRLPGSLFGGPDAKYVLGPSGVASNYYVINRAGEVWAHPRTASGVQSGTKLNGPSLFGGPNDKYALLMEGTVARILVVNNQGEVWAHDLSCSSPSFGCNPDTIAAGHKLTGPGLFGAPNDQYVVSSGPRLLVINTSGEVWARNITESTVGPAFKLNGPGLFGTPNNSKYVVAYTFVCCH